MRIDFFFGLSLVVCFLQDMVVLPYKDSLLLFSRYLQQLVMESLGKEFDLDGNRVCAISKKLSILIALLRFFHQVFHLEGCC